MPIRPHSHNIVALAKYLRPAMFNERWLVTNGIIHSGDSIVGDHAVTEGITNLKTLGFDLTVMPGRMQLVLREASTHTHAELAEIANNLLSKIPDPEFTNIGLNHIWRVEPEADEGWDVAKFSREKLAPVGNLRTIGNNKTLWSATANLDWEEFQLRVIASPFRLSLEDFTPDRKVSFDCNFNLTIKDAGDAVSTVLAAVSRFQDAGEHSYQLATILESDRKS